MRAVTGWLYRMRKMGAGVVPLIALWLVPESLISFETIQLWVAVGTLPPTAVFIIAYTPERPDRHWFGSSLLLLAWAVMFYTSSVVLFRMLGGDYWARPYMVKASVALTFTAMVMRTCVLIVDQSRDRRGFGWWLYRMAHPYRQR